MFYNTNDDQFFGMTLIWWVIWMIMIFWIFLTPYDIPGQRTKKEQPLNLLKKRFALREIDKKEFEEMKKILET